MTRRGNEAGPFPTVRLIQFQPDLPPRTPPPESSGAGCEEEKMDDAIRQAKLANPTPLASWRVGLCGIVINVYC
jgi:hypothetical protein